MEANAVLDGTVVLGGPPTVMVAPPPRPSSPPLSSRCSGTSSGEMPSSPPSSPPLRPLSLWHGTNLRRHKGEDRSAQLVSGDTSLYLVADGHGGSGAARQAAACKG